jgi:uncharacterized protein (TIGR02300 family)
LAKPEWGTKRMCLSCGARFYDFSRSPIACPACGAVFDLETVSRSRRSRPAPRAVAAAAGLPVEDPELVVGPVAGVEDADADVDVEEDETVIDETDDAEEDESLIEDASELGEDDDDVGEVIDGVDEEEDHR